MLNKIDSSIVSKVYGKIEATTVCLNSRKFFARWRFDMKRGVAENPANVGNEKSKITIEVRHNRKIAISATV